MGYKFIHWLLALYLFLPMQLFGSGIVDRIDIVYAQRLFVS